MSRGEDGRLRAPRPEWGVTPVDAASSATLLLEGKRLRRELSARPGLREVRIAVLGGSTSHEVVGFLELLLLDAGFRPEIYQSDYNRYYEEAVLAPERLAAFRPDLAIVLTSCMNVRAFAPVSAGAAELEQAVAAEAGRFASIWSALHERLGCQVIQNNFELPPVAVLGNLDAVSCGGRTRFIHALNLEFARMAAGTGKLLIHDVHALSARLGLSQWFDWRRWYAYKLVTTPDASLAMARSLAAMIRAVYGKSRKCLVLDLDDTLWGGVIGDDGPDKIEIGRETPEAEAFTGFQEYCLALRERGVLLAVCSKNDEAVAKIGLAHPDSVLRLEHFAAFRANWAPKPHNLQSIAAELHLGVESFVFVDDNPAERALVAAQLPGVAVPDVGSEVSGFVAVLEAARYFEPAALSAEDLARAEHYAKNTERTALQAKLTRHGEYLDSLHMVAEIESFRPEYLDRIAQLTNKTNQYNLTTRRCTQADIEAMANDPGHLTLYGKLSDAFGDSGLVSVVAGRKDGTVLHLELWLMSCRVLERGLEAAMLDVLVEKARAAGLETLHGQHVASPKNGMVAGHYEKLGFQCVARDPEGKSSTWALSLADYQPQNRHVTRKGADR